jgi:hypothetical protein
LHAGVRRLAKTEIAFRANAEVLGDHKISSDFAEATGQFRRAVERTVAERIHWTGSTVSGRSDSEENIRASLRARERAA